MQPSRKSISHARAAVEQMNAELRSIVVNAPVAKVYGCCLRFQEFHRFIPSVSKIEKSSPTQFSCASTIDGKEVRSAVEIMMRVPNRRIAWQANSDYFGVGVVFLDPLLGGTTKVTVKVRSSIEPARLAAVLRQYLGDFKRFVEEEHAKSS